MQGSVTIRVNTMCEHETPLKGDFSQLRTTRMPRRHLRQYFPANVISCSARFQYSFPCIFGRKSAYLLVWLEPDNLFARRSDLSLSDSLDAETPKRDKNTMANVGIRAVISEFGIPPRGCSHDQRP